MIHEPVHTRCGIASSPKDIHILRFFQKRFIELAEVLAKPKIIISTVEKLLKAFENACPPLEGYSNGVDKSKVGGEIKKLQPKVTII